VSSDIFTLSIEDRAGHSFQHGFHLGTIERVARTLAEGCYHGRIANKLPVVTVALKRAGEVFDVYDGEWQSAREDRMYREMMEETYAP
jgi:hypothetical protein